MSSLITTPLVIPTGKDCACPATLYRVGKAPAPLVLDRREALVADQSLFTRLLDVSTATASWRRVHAGPVDCRYADGWRQYLPRASDALHPYATPGDAARLQGLPPTLLVTAHDDP